MSDRLPVQPGLDEREPVVPNGKEMMTIMVSYGDNRILHASTVHFTPQEASQLMQVICQLIVGVPELRDGEAEADRAKHRAKYYHNHVCLICSPDGIHQGTGCINCRQTGMDQTPCVNCPGAVPE